jgi:hypothetical protein
MPDRKLLPSRNTPCPSIQAKLSTRVAPSKADCTKPWRIASKRSSAEKPVAEGCAQALASSNICSSNTCLAHKPKERLVARGAWIEFIAVFDGQFRTVNGERLAAQKISCF